MTQQSLPDTARQWAPLYNILPGTPFADALATGLLQHYGDQPENLAPIRILLPTRRACRTLRDTFLRITDGQALLLPKMQPLGDIDEEELSLEIAAMGDNTLTAADLELAFPPAIPPLKRQILLARELMASPHFHYSPDQAFALASALGRLLDQTYTENLDLKNLPSLVKHETLSEHWQITIDFLEILSHKWPQILAERGMIDKADRRNRLLLTLAAHWQKHPPSTPVIAAGSTGSIPAAAELLKIVSRLPQGTVILPGLDPHLDAASLAAIEDSHPQTTLYTLLQKMEIDPQSVPLWPYTPPPPRNAAEPEALTRKHMDMRRFLASEIMRPAAATAQWKYLNICADKKHNLEKSLEHLGIITCDTIQQEARIISLILRETLLTPARTAALITPDRNLARRTAALCRRWGIELDDSAGQPLDHSPCGTFLRLISTYIAAPPSIGTLLSLLKHSHARIQMPAGTKTDILHNIEKTMLRGVVKLKYHDDILPPQSGTNSHAPSFTPPDTYKDFANAVKAAFTPLFTLNDTPDPSPIFDNQRRYKMHDLLTTHLHIAEYLAAPAEGIDDTYGHPLWQGDDGEAAARFFSDLLSHSHDMPAVTPAEYSAIIENLMRAITVRSPYGTHPRLYILGQLEARLINVDTIIMGGLNEGSWPPDSQNDMWMSRPMRKEFGLPSPESAIGLAAHDFVQAFCHRNVIMTRALRNDGAPTRPARWLQRLETVLQALDIDLYTRCNRDIYKYWEQQLDRADTAPVQIKRPEPRPPLSARPRSLYVTAIENWMRDPYSIYARYILGLKKLDDIEKPLGAAERGTMLHNVLEKFIKTYPRTLPDNAEDEFIRIAKDVLSHDLQEDILRNFWWPRIQRAGAWFVNHEREWRIQALPALQEVTGSYTLDPKAAGAAFTIKAKADRIDRMHDGSAALIDYKSGTIPSQKNIENGLSPQMPLEGVILQQGGFTNIDTAHPGYIGHWKLSGGSEAGKTYPVKGDYTALLESAEQGLNKLVRSFSDEKTPYYSLPNPDTAPPKAFQDYAHLARVQEWTTQDDAEDGNDY